MKKKLRPILLAPLLGFLLFTLLPSEAYAAKAIAITKEVSVDGGVSWHDAETADLGPGTAMGAQYRLKIEACGLCPLVNAVVTDETLGINQNIPDPGSTGKFLFTWQDPGFENLNQPQLCADLDPAAKQNIAKVTAFTEDGKVVEDQNQAWVRCACLDIEKEVSVDGGVTWNDADSMDQAPGSGMGAVYRLRVKNCGGTKVENIMVTDASLGIDKNIGSLGPMEEKTFTAAMEGFGGLQQSGLCENPDPAAKENIARVTGTSNGTQLSDEDAAWVKCVCVDLEKRVSVDGGLTWLDADSMEDGPGTSSGALYQLEVKNCGGIPLTDVMLDDPDLNISVPVADLAAGESRVFDAASPDFGNLDQPGRCDNLDPAAKQNVAEVSAFGAGSQVFAMDEAWVKCLCIDVEKEVSVDGGQTWFDADDLAQAPTTAGEALYRVKVENCGGFPLTDVTINDPQLGLLENIGGLQQGESKTFDRGTEGFESLQVTDRCVDPDPPAKQNVVTVTANGNGATISDEDQAWVKCACLTLEKQVSVDGGQNWFDADEPIGAPTTSAAAEYRLQVSNCSDFDFDKVVLNDPDLWLNQETGPLPAGQSRTLTAADTGFEKLDQPGRCQGSETPAPPALANTATATGFIGDASLMVEDTAWVNCIPCSGSIGDFVWDDLDRDGIQDAGEPGLAGVIVSLKDADGAVIATTTTDASGFYQFTGLCAGDYTVDVVTPDGFEPSACDQGGDDTLDNDCTGEPVTLPANDAQDPTIDFGFTQPQATLGDRVWEDLNNNGIQDAGEPGLAGVTVNLLDCQGVATGLTTTTAAGGSYSFTVDPGQYIVEFVAPADFLFSAQDQGADDTLDSDANPANGRSPCITLAADENNPTVDAGLFNPQPEIDIEKATNGQDADTVPGPTLPVDSQVTWTYVVTNTGNVPLANVAVSDDKLGAISCPKSSLAAGESMTCSATGTVVPGPYTNQGCVTGVTPGQMEIGDCDHSNYFGARAAIDIEKSTNGEDADSAPGPTLPFGSQVTWTYVVTNTGNVPLSNVAVSDNKLGAISCPQAALAPGESMTCTAAGTAAAGPYANLGTATGVTPGNMTVSDEDPSHYTGAKPNIDVEKFVSTDGKTWLDADDAPGIKVPLCPSGGFSKCDPDSDDDSSGDNYSKDDSSKDDSSQDDGYRSRYSSKDDSSRDDKSSDDDDYKSGDDDSSDDGNCVDSGDCQSKVFFKFVVTNNGQTQLNNIALTDSRLSLSKCTVPASLGMGQSFECVIGPFKPVSGQHMNTATAKGDFAGITAMDTDKAHYFGCVGKGTGTPGYWKNHPEAWPVQEITIGGKTYTKAKAIMLMQQPTARDKTYTLIQALIAAKLNVLSCNVSFCIDDIIMKADQWFSQYPVGSGVSGSSSAWKMGEPLYLKLDAYNNGKLCAPSRDAGGSSKDDSSSDDDRRYSKKK